MAEALGKTLPDLAEDAFTRIDEGAATGAAAGSTGVSGDTVEHVFEDPEVRKDQTLAPALALLIFL